MFSTVLFPIDQSREALETAGKALELAKSHGSRMVLLSVVQPERPEMHDHATVAPLLDQARAQFEQAVVEQEQGDPLGAKDVAHATVNDFAELLLVGHGGDLR